MRFILFLGALLLASVPAAACPFPCFEGEGAGSGYERSWGFSGGSRALSIAGRYKGRNPTGRSRLWCADFVGLVERKAGRPGTGSSLAKSYLRYGRGVSHPRPGDIAVYSRKGGGHVGYVVRVSGGKVLLRGGNQCGRSGARIVCDSWRSINSAIAYRRP